MLVRHHTSKCISPSKAETALLGHHPSPLEVFQRPTGVDRPPVLPVRLPLAVADYGRSDVLWGRVRMISPAATRVTSLAARRGRRFTPLRTVTTNTLGVFGLRHAHVRGQRYRLRWTSPEGATYTGPPIRPTRPA